MNGFGIELNTRPGSIYELRLMHMYRCVAIDPIDGVM